MLTLDALKEIGVKPEEGLSRCMNNEAFYLSLVKRVAGDDGFKKLKDAVEAGDLETGFEAAHALKGVLGNLSLTPLYESVAEITELLRSRTEMDYTPMLEAITQQQETLEKICE